MQSLWGYSKSQKEKVEIRSEFFGMKLIPSQLWDDDFTCSTFPPPPRVVHYLDFYMEAAE